MQTDWNGSSLANGSYGCPALPGHGMQYGRQKPIDSPYLDFATLARPKTFSDVLDWSEYVYEMSDDLKGGLDRLFGYFSTRLNISDVRQTELGPADLNHVNEWRQLLEQNVQYLLEELQLGQNLSVYGNDFITITMIQHRLIQCPECGWSAKINELRKYSGVDFNFHKMRFTARCQGKCKTRGNNRTREMKVIQFSDKGVGGLVFKHWPIRELEFDFLEIRNKLRIFWRIPSRLKTAVLNDNDLDLIHDMDWAALEAICQDKLLEFDDTAMFHAKEPQLSGLMNRGLGLPRTLAMFRMHWLVQLLKKQCQSLAAAYVSPMEFFSLAQPNQAGMSGDPGMSIAISEFSNHVDNMIAQHRRDPTRKFFLPLPVQYQIAGASANQYVPVDLLKWSTAELSKNMVPEPMLNGTLTLQTTPVFVRMFEAMNRSIPAVYNSFCFFCVRRIAALLQIEPVRVMHSPVSVEDNLAIDQLLQQGAMMGKNSDTAWQSRINVDSQWEQSVMLAEQEAALSLQAKLQEIQEQQALGQQTQAMAQSASAADPRMGGEEGQGTEGGMAGMGTLLPSQGFKPSRDFQLMEQESQMIAQALLSIPPAQRHQELAILRQTEQSFHALVTSAMEKLRQQMDQSARSQLYPTA